MEDQGIMLFPWIIGREFLEALDYKGGRRCVAVYWEPEIDDMLRFDGKVYEEVVEIVYFLDLCDFPTINDWLIENDIGFGGTRHRPTHWLVVDMVDEIAWVAPVELARQCVEGQAILGWDVE